MRSQAHGRTTPYRRVRRTAPAGSPCSLRPVCGGTIGRLALHLFLPTFFPACPSDAVEIVALHETVWSLDGLPTHGPGRLAMMGSSVRFRAALPKNWRNALPAHLTWE